MVEPLGPVSVQTGADHTTLTIKNCTPDNSGRYRVVAENKAGRDSVEMEIVVRGTYLLFFLIQCSSI